MDPERAATWKVPKPDEAGQPSWFRLASGWLPATARTRTHRRTRVQARDPDGPCLSPSRTRSERGCQARLVVADEDSIPGVDERSLDQLAVRRERRQRLGLRHPRQLLLEAARAVALAGGVEHFRERQL